MKPTAIKTKKHLNFQSLQQCFSSHIMNINDHRRQGSCEYTLHDALMSGFACMYFQDPSLAEFQRHLEEGKHQNNLRTLFGVERIPKDSQLRDIVDRVESEHLRPVFNDLFPGYAEVNIWRHSRLFLITISAPLMVFTTIHLRRFIVQSA